MLGVTNPASLQTAGSRENLSRGVERRRKESKARNSKKKISPVFILTRASGVYQHVALKWLIRGRNAGFVASKLSGKWCLENRTDSSVWRLSLALNGNIRGD